MLLLIRYLLCRADRTLGRTWGAVLGATRNGDPRLAPRTALRRTVSGPCTNPSLRACHSHHDRVAVPDVAVVAVVVFVVVVVVIVVVAVLSPKTRRPLAVSTARNDLGSEVHLHVESLWSLSEGHRD